LAAYLAHLGNFVLLVDLDPQANATSGAGIDHKNISAGLYEVLMGPYGLHQVSLPLEPLGLKIIPTNQNLAGANIELASAPQREYRLHQELLEIRHDFDYIIIDSPPSLGLLTINGLVAADDILIPVQCEYYALEGLGQLLNTVSLIKEHLKPDLNILGAVMTMYDDRNKLAKEVFNELYHYFPNKIFRTVIPRNAKLAEAPSFGKHILHYDPSGRGAKAYERLARELLEYTKH